MRGERTLLKIRIRDDDDPSSDQGYHYSSRAFGLHCPDRDIGLQTFDREEALRLVDPLLPQTLSYDSIHLSVCPSFSTKICLLLRRDQPLSCLRPFIASSKVSSLGSIDNSCSHPQKTLHALLPHLHRSSYTRLDLSWRNSRDSNSSDQRQ